MPTHLVGPRLVVNVRVPPAPPGLTPQPHLLGKVRIKRSVYLLLSTKY